MAGGHKSNGFKTERMERGSDSARKLVEEHRQRRNGNSQSSGPTISEQAGERLDQYLRDRR